jgi:hypothetical protein
LPPPASTAPSTGSQLGAGRRIPPEKPGGEEEEILEVEPAHSPAVLGELYGRGGDEAHGQGVAVAQPTVEEAACGRIPHTEGVDPLLETLGQGGLPPAILGHAVPRGTVLAHERQGLEEVGRATPLGHLEGEGCRTHLLLKRIPAPVGLPGRHELRGPAHQALQLATGGLHLRGARRPRLGGREVHVRVLDQTVEKAEELDGSESGLAQLLQERIGLSRQALQIRVPKMSPEAVPFLHGELLEGRVQTHLEGTLTEETGAERVDGAQERPVDRLQRFPKALSFLVGLFTTGSPA